MEVRVVSPPPGARIRFTTDGSAPSLRNGQDYLAPWSLSQTTILKVAAFSNGVAVTQTSTHSYLLLDGTLTQSSRPVGYPHGDSAWEGEPSHYGMDPRVVGDPRYQPRMKAALRALPTLSLVCAPKDLFGRDQGLYLNTQERGADWERRCSLEWIDTNGVSGFQIDCGFQMQGNTGRRPDKTPKHSFRVMFKKAYGPTKLRYPVFPDSNVTRFDGLVLRADYNNAWTHWKAEDNERAQRIRDSWLKDSHRAMGYLAGHNRYVHLYLNGLYWGIYDVAERPDASFAAAYLGGDREDYDVLDDSGLKSGAAESVQEFRRLARARPPLSLEQVGERIDWVHFMDYLLLNFYAGNQDWGEYQNWYVIRRHGPDPRFRHYVWDGEITLQSLADDVVNDPDRPPMALGRLLARDPEYRLAFADRVQKHCFGVGALTPEANAARWRQRAHELELPLLAESARWGYCRRNPPFTIEDWYRERDRLLGVYFPRRTQVLLRQLRSAGLYPKVGAPEFQVVPIAGNSAKSKVTFAPAAIAGTVLYVTQDGTDPRTPGKGEPAPGAQICVGELTVTPPITVKARARTGIEWSALVVVEVPVAPK